MERRPPKTRAPLTDKACRDAKPGPKLRKLSDAVGLQLWVQLSGSKLWRAAYRYGGQQTVQAIGAYPKLTLAEARAR